ncbi:MAG: iron-sulfur cluster assembly accessory protein [Xanthomonadales bacterium]|nr:iron-sulfur cluster assembly accessory protein [Xanthomonadales bacterium]
MAITLTATAAQRARDFLGSQPDAIGLRFGVRKTGCSGWGYEIDLASAVDDGDQVFEQDGVRIVVDAHSLTLVDGTEIDFVRRGLNHEFVFRNPNAKAECGCGESFTTEVEAEV